nr:MAG TPA: tail fiber assembly protein [Caudoviricetes sp.]
MNSIPQTKPVCQLDENGFYICQTVADADPMQPENWLIPAGCIDTEPPEVKPNLAAKWQPESKTWAYLPDHRGKTAYRTDNGQPETVETVGELPAHLTLLAPPSELHQWNGKAWVVDKAKQAEAEKTAFQAAQAAKLTELANAAQAFVDKHAKTDIVPAFEQETWAMQGAEARAWADDDNAPTPILDSIAHHRNIDRIMLIRAALRKTQQYEALAAGVAGQRQALQVQIERAKTLDDLAAIEIAFRLPEMGG